MNRTNTFWHCLRSGIIATLVLLPFHALFTTWLGSTFGHLDLFRIWKELLIALMVPMAFWLVYKDQQLRRWFTGSRLVLLVILYVFLHLLLGGVALVNGAVNREALIYALLINLRFPIFLLLVMVVASKTDLKKHWQKILLGPAAIVITFGLMQQFILPPDFLRHFGYGPETIPAVQTVDQKLEYQRIQSTLRGANPLGAYLVVVLTAGATLLLAASKTNKLKWGIGFAVGMMAVFLTYSRSAWLGIIASLSLLCFWKFPHRQRRLLLIAAAVFVLAFAGTTWLLRDNDTLQNTLFHSDETSQSSESSNAARGRHLAEGLQSVVRQPLGAGPGTAGPASVRNDHPARIAENYYIQIAQEVGLIGLTLFIAINFLVAQKLWHRRRDPLSQILLASLIGLTLINLLSHAWTDDTLSLIWGGLAGMALAQAGLPNNPHSQAKTS